MFDRMLNRYYSGRSGSSYGGIRPDGITWGRVVSIAGAVLMAIAMFLPFMSITTFTYSASASTMDGNDAYAFFAIIIFVVINAVKHSAKGMIITGVISLILSWLKSYVTQLRLLRELGVLYKYVVRLESGAQALLAASIVIIIGGIIIRHER